MDILASPLNSPPTDPPDASDLPLTSKTLIDNIMLRNSIQSWLNQLGLTHEQADSVLPVAAAPPVPHLAPAVRVAAQVAQPPVPQYAKEDLEKRDEVRHIACRDYLSCKNGEYKILHINVKARTWMFCTLLCTHALQMAKCRASIGESCTHRTAI